MATALVPADPRYSTEGPLLPGLWLERCDGWVCLRFDEPRPVLSNAVVNGGLTTASRWLNLKVSGDEGDADTPPADTVNALSLGYGWDGNTVAMMTAASMNSLRIRYRWLEGHLVLVAVTSGLANARRVGDRAEYRRLADPVHRQGTINIAVVTDLRLTTAVMVEAMMLVTEAKTAALQERHITSPVSGAVATGTGTDAMALFAGVRGTRADFAGKHTLLGETLGKLSLVAIGDSVDQTGAAVSALEPGQQEVNHDPAE